MDRFEEMQTFIQVVDAGSLSAAAEQLSIAKSAVSRRLNELETRLGVQLITRTTRRLNLTESGREFYHRCRRLLAGVEEAEQAITCGQVELRGTLRIAAPLSFGISHLSPLLNQFLKLHPDLRLDLNLNDRTLNLMEEDVDLAIRIGKLKDSTLIARYLAPVRRFVCASPDYLQRYGEPQQPEDLENHVGLIYSYIPEAGHWQFKRSPDEWITPRVPHRIRANNGRVLLQAAIDGLGVLSSPHFICSEAVEQGLLQPILSDYELPATTLYAIYPKQRYLPRRVRVLIDFLVEKLRDYPSC